MMNNYENRISSLETRLRLIEGHINPTKFRRVEIIPTFPLHDTEFPEDLLIRILAYLSKKDFLTCKVSQMNYVNTEAFATVDV